MKSIMQFVHERLKLNKQSKVIKTEPIDISRIHFEINSDEYPSKEAALRIIKEKCIELLDKHYFIDSSLIKEIILLDRAWDEDSYHCYNCAVQITYDNKIYQCFYGKSKMGVQTYTIGDWEIDSNKLFLGDNKKPKNLEEGLEICFDNLALEIKNK